MRLFVALEVPDAWRDAARSVAAELVRTSGVSLRPVDPALMHLTLRFLGDVADDRLQPLDAALMQHVPPVDIALALGAAGTFGPPARTSVAWLAVDGDLDSLRALAARVEVAVQEAGLAAGEARFSPHLTLARVGQRSRPAERRAVAEAARGAPTPAPLPFRTHEVVLVRSHLGGGAPRYEVIGRYS